jgi:UDP-N-acetyl-D-mannosaminuronate dehydrogenase
VVIGGLGYVGLPTALALHRRQVGVIGVDVSASRIASIKNRAVEVVVALAAFERETAPRECRHMEPGVRLPPTSFTSAKVRLLCGR